MATVQQTRPRAVVGALRRAAWEPKSVLRHSISAALRTIIFYFQKDFGFARLGKEKFRTFGEKMKQRQTKKEC